MKKMYECEVYEYECVFADAASAAKAARKIRKMYGRLYAEGQIDLPLSVKKSGKTVLLSHLPRWSAIGMAPIICIPHGRG